MSFREIVRFELAHQLRRRSVWLHAAVVLAVGFHMTREMVAGEEGDAFVNAPVEILGYVGIVGLVALAVTAALAGDAATRDARARIDALLHTTPVGRWTLLGGRFLAVFALNALLLVGVAAVVALAVAAADAAPERVAPFRAAAYLRAYLLLGLPNAFIGCALLFAAALASRRAVTSYVLGGALFVLTLFSMEAGPTLLGFRGAAHLDPFGFTPTRILIRSWSPVQRNALLVPFDGWLASNRLLWIAVAAAVGLLAVRAFRFAPSASGRTTLPGTGPRRRTAGPDASRAPDVPVAVPTAARSFGRAAHVRQTLAVARHSVGQVVARRGWLPPVLLAGLVLLAGPELLEHLGVPLVPTTAGVFTVFEENRASVLLTLLVAFYAGELVWEERDARMDAIVGAAPVPDGVLLAGRLLGLGLAVAAAQLLLMASGVALQLSLGHAELEPGLYLSVLFGLRMADYGLWIALAVAVHVAVDQKYVGHLVVLLVCALSLAAGLLGVERDLLVYGAGPGWTYSDMRGFGPSLAPWLGFRAYWGAWALLLVLAARLLQVRGAERGVRTRLRLARLRLTRPVAGGVAAAAALVATTGGFVFYNTDVLNDHRSSDERGARRAEYERRYGRYEGVAQPRLVGTRLRVEIFPEERRAEVRGAYRLVNRSGVAIDSVHVATASGVETGEVRFDRPAARVPADDDLGHRIYALAAPLRPGDSLEMHFAVRFRPRGFTSRGVSPDVARNGTHFTGAEWLPAVGYRPERELGRAADRRAHGLPPRPAVPPLHDAAAPWDVTGREAIDFEAVVGTDAGQVAVAPGALRRTWTEGGRRYFHYATDAPIRNDFAVFSARYAVREARWGDVRIQVLHHPGHTWNAERIAGAARASLESYARRFGPYPHGQLRFVEHPGASTVLHASPVNVSYDEGFAVFDPERDARGIDLAFAVVAHEVAHQWWGDRLVPAYVEGAPLLTESLAWYSAMGVVEETHGPEHLRRLLDVFREAYLTPRSRAGVPLLRTADRFLAYRKGPFAMYALREYVGQARVDAALRRLLEAHGPGEPPLPTSLDLYRELRTVTPDSLRPLLADLFERNAFWEMEAEAATAEPAGAGAWRVTLDVAARKVVVDSAGNETELPMDDPVEVGVFAAAEDGEERGEPLYLAVHRVRSGESTITVTVPRRPARAGIDPRRLLVDTEGGDNVVEVRTGSGEPGEERP